MKIYLSASNQTDNIYNTQAQMSECDVCYLIAQKTQDYLSSIDGIECKLGGKHDTMTNKVKASNDFANEISEFIKTLGYDKVNYLQLSILENWEALKDGLMQNFPQLFTSDAVSQIETFRQGMYIGNLDMTAIPHWKDGIIVIVPIISFLTSFILTLFAKRNCIVIAAKIIAITIKTFFFINSSSFIKFLNFYFTFVQYL